MPFLLAVSYAARSDFVLLYMDARLELAVALIVGFAARRQSE